MGKRGRLSRWLVALVFALGSCHPGWFGADRMWDWLPPKIPDVLDPAATYGGGCYEISNGRLRWLDCEVTLSLSYQGATVPEDRLLAYAGGHLHPLPAGADPERPLGNLESPIGPTSDGGKRVEGRSGGDAFPITFRPSEVCGTVTWYVEYIFPRSRWAMPDRSDPRWTWVRLWDDRWMAFTWIDLDVGLEGLEALPASPDTYIRCAVAKGCIEDSPDADTLHPAVHHGTPVLLGLVQELAQAFHEAHPQWRLRILDMSLPRGGLFEGAHQEYNWKPPHSWHRLGQSVDFGSWVVTSEGQPAYPPFRALTNRLERLVESRQMPLFRVEEGSGKIHFQLDGRLKK